MSADNWTKCPRCAADDSAKRRKRIAEAKQSYGVVPAEEYIAMVSKAEKRDDEREDTLREDYELNMQESGAFSVDYHAGCEVCGWRFTFKHEANAIKVNP